MHWLLLSCGLVWGQTAGPMTPAGPTRTADTAPSGAADDDPDIGEVSGLSSVLEDQLEHTNATLVAKLNRQIAKKQDKLRISAAAWLQKKLGLAALADVTP